MMKKLKICIFDWSLLNKKVLDFLTFQSNILANIFKVSFLTSKVFCSSTATIFSQEDKNVHFGLMNIKTIYGSKVAMKMYILISFQAAFYKNGIFLERRNQKSKFFSQILAEFFPSLR